MTPATQNDSTPGWQRCTRELASDAALWLYFMMALTLGRAAFLLVLYPSPAPAWSDVVSVLLHGLRFDMQVATAWMLPSWLLGLLSWRWPLAVAARVVRRVSGPLLLTLVVFLEVAEIAFYQEYAQPFDQNVFGFIYDGPGAVLQTLVDEYHLWRRLGSVLIVAALASIGLRFWMARPRHFVTQALQRAQAWQRMLIVSLLLIAVVGGLRGSWGRRPAMRKWSAITSNALLNDAVLNPLSALGYVFKDYRRLNNDGLRLFDVPGGLQQAARRVFGDKPGVGGNLDVWAERVAGGSTEAPRHIFLIVMESYDIWSLQEHYRGLGVSNSLSALAQRGVFFDRFLPSSTTTMASLAAIVTGMPDAGARVARRQQGLKGFPSAMGTLFKRLGYTTRAFYGGMTSWQRLDDFCRAQGFDEIYGSGDIVGSSSLKSLDSSAWGVDDDVLFDFVSEKVSGAAPASSPSFNLIVTLSYHPPYDLDEETPGFAEVGALSEHGVVSSARMNGHILGHLRFADRQLGAFVADVESHLRDPLFVLTGDHYSRRPPRPSSTLYERSAVPLVFVGPESLSRHRGASVGVGSHIDILPTLVELAAPAGFRYTAWGRDLFEPAAHPVAIGYERVIGAEFLIELPAPQASADPLQRAAIDHHDDLRALAWWRAVHGAQLPDMP